MDFNLLSQEAAKYGIFAVLFVFLLISFLKAFTRVYEDSKKRDEEIRKSNDEREKKYIDTISTLSESLKCVEELSGDVKDIKACLTRRRKQ